MAEIFGRNENVSYILPYTDNPNAGLEYHKVSESQLEIMMVENCDDVLQVTEVNGHLYVHFFFQLTNDFNVVVVDDLGVQEIASKIGSNLATIRVLGGEPSDRVGMLGVDWFDYQVSDDTDLDYLIEQIAGDMMEI